MTLRRIILFTLFSLLIFNAAAQENVKRDILAAVKINGKWGYINTDGLMVIPPTFDGAATFSETYAAVKSTNGFWGYIDRTGQWKLAPALYRAGGFNNGRAHVIFLDLPDSIFYQVYMSKMGTYVHELPLTEIGWSYHDGLLRAQGESMGEKYWGYKDTMGEWAITIKYQEAQDFSEGIAGVMIGNKWGYIDRTDSFIAPSLYDEVFLFHNGHGRVKKGDEYMLLNKQGKAILTTKKELDYIAAEGRIGFNENGKYGFLDLNGKVVVKPIYEPMVFNYFSEGLAVVAKNLNGARRYGYIDINGNEVIPPQYEHALPFEYGLALVKTGGKYGFIDKTGKMVIPAIYEDGKNFGPTY